MPNPKNINLQRYPDGTPSVLRKRTVYTDLYFYRKSDVLVQLTRTFCARFLPKYGDRTVVVIVGYLVKEPNHRLCRDAIGGFMPFKIYYFPSNHFILK